MTAFPADPERGDTHTKRGIEYEWQGYFWRPTDYSAFWGAVGDAASTAGGSDSKAAGLGRWADVILWDSYQRSAVGTSADSGQAITTFGAGTLAITSGELRGGGGANAGLVMDCGYANALINGTFRTRGTTSTSRSGIVFRYVDSSNYLLGRIGTTAGTSIKLFKVVDGVETELGTTQPSPALNAEVPYRLSVRALGALLRLHLDAGAGLTTTLTYTLADGDETTFGTATKIGVRLGVLGSALNINARRLGA